MENPKLSIIIVNWNTKELLSRCLESLVSSKGLIFDKSPLTKKTKDKSRENLFLTEIIVIDNASTDGSQEMVAQKFPFVVLLKNKENLGFSKANNQGIKIAKGKYILILNSDTIVKKTAIEILIDYLEQHREIDIIGPKLINPDGSPQANCGRFPTLPIVAIMLFKEHFGGSNLVRSSPLTSKQVDWLMGAAFVAKKEVFETIGGFDEKIFMYMEEVEWFYRAAQSGFKTYFLKDAEIVHLGRGSAKKGKTDPILNIYKGILYFYQKHRTFWELILVKLLLKTKALLALAIGFLKNDSYLKNTYGQAFKIN